MTTKGLVTAIATAAPLSRPSHQIHISLKYYGLFAVPLCCLSSSLTNRQRDLFASSSHQDHQFSARDTTHQPFQHWPNGLESFPATLTRTGSLNFPPLSRSVRAGKTLLACGLPLMFPMPATRCVMPSGMSFVSMFLPVRSSANSFGPVSNSSKRG
jgi:hypothetical protein